LILFSYENSIKNASYNNEFHMKNKITKRPTSAPTTTPQDARLVDSFIGGAPDAIPPPEVRKGVMRGKREQISHTLPPDLLAKIDEHAQLKGLTRAGLINLAVSEYLK
jgi:hypothetical protein